jgi:parallel beta-helix repeat protein
MILSRLVSWILPRTDAALPRRRSDCRRFRPQVEGLEARELLSGNGLLSGNALVQSLASPSAQPAFNRPVVVHAGESIQAAVDAASAGTTIYIEPGVYQQSVAIAKSNIKLIGLTGPKGAGVVLQNPGGADNGIGVTAGGKGFVLRNVTVQGFGSTGVMLQGVDGFEISNVVAADNGDSGIFALASTHGRILNSKAYGHKDTGIYVGQSRDVEVRSSEAFGNVNGIEVENSLYVKIIGNSSHDNTAGILVVLLPGLDAKHSEYILIRGNDVANNNVPNFGKKGELESFVPSGTGIMVLGADAVTVEHNRVTGNEYVGMGVGSILPLGKLAGLPPQAFADIEPFADGVRVHSNIVTGNGVTTVGDHVVKTGVDLYWDGTGRDNLWYGNKFVTSQPVQLPMPPKV